MKIKSRTESCLVDKASSRCSESNYIIANIRSCYRAMHGAAVNAAPLLCNEALRLPPSNPPTLDRSSDASVVYHHSRERSTHPILSRDGDVQQSDGERYRCATATGAPTSHYATSMAAATDTTATTAPRGGWSRRRRVVSPSKRFSAHDLCHVYGK